MTCHFKARLLNPPLLAVVRHYCLCETGLFLIYGKLIITCVIYSDTKRQTVTHLNQQSFLSHLTAQMGGSLGNQFPVYYCSESSPHAHSNFKKYLVYTVNSLALLWEALVFFLYVFFFLRNKSRGCHDLIDYSLCWHATEKTIILHSGDKFLLSFVWCFMSLFFMSCYFTVMEVILALECL